ncbi:hypothetical protein Tco_1283994 [Tanacetum coccineum]
MPKYTIKSTNKATLKEYDLKSALYQTMHEIKSFNRNDANHTLYHALMEALIEDENVIDKGVADKETPKGKAPSKGSKSGKYASTKEPVEEPIAEVAMDDAVNTTGEDVIDNLTQYLWLGPVYNLLKGTCTSNIEIEYNFQECFNALTDKLNWNNPEGDRYPFDLSKPLPLQGRPGYLTVAVDYFFNNDLKYLKTSDPEKTYTTSITKIKAAPYEILGIEDMTHTLWSTIKHVYDKDAKNGIKHWGERRKLCVQKLHGYGHLEEVVVKRADRQLYMFKEGDFVDLHLNDIEDMLLLAVQHKLFHLNDSDILGVESYQKKLNITAPQKTFPKIEFKELYTPSYKPPGVIYEDLNKQKRVMRADELYKFSDETLKKVQDELHHRILDFRLRYNKEMSRRKWTAIDKRRLELMVKLIDK